MFSETTRAWFERTFEAPTPAQIQGWPVIASGEHTLIQAPTGSGKTLAAFRYAIDRLTAAPAGGLRVLYVSPLKALNYDVERNLRGPLAGLQSQLRVAVRTGDTPQKERAAMLREPPDILITTPESLFLLLTSQARELLRGVDTLIMDEVQAIAGTKRGSHFALSVELLERLVDKPFQRIGLSATQRPLEEIGRFVSGARPIRLVDAGVARTAAGGRAGRGHASSVPPARSQRELDLAVDLPRAARLVRAHPGDRLLNGGAWRAAYAAIEPLGRELRGAPRLLAREQRVLIEEDLKAGRIPCLVATSSLELGIDMGAVDLVVQVESPKSVARGLQRIGRAGHSLHEVSKGRIFPKFRADLLECAVVAQRIREGAIETQIPRNPSTYSRSRSSASARRRSRSRSAGSCAAPIVRRPVASAARTCSTFAGRYPSDEFAELRPRII